MRREVILLILTGRVTKVRDGKCTERHYGDTCDLFMKHENKITNAMKIQKITLYEMSPLITRRTSVFHDFMQISNILSHSINDVNIVENFEISSEHNDTMKSIKEIMKSVPKSSIVDMHAY